MAETKGKKRKVAEKSTEPDPDPKSDSNESSTGETKEKDNHTLTLLERHRVTRRPLLIGGQLTLKELENEWMQTTSAVVVGHKPADEMSTKEPPRVEVEWTTQSITWDDAEDRSFYRDPESSVTLSFIWYPNKLERAQEEIRARFSNEWAVIEDVFGERVGVDRLRRLSRLRIEESHLDAKMGRIENFIFPDRRTLCLTWTANREATTNPHLVTLLFKLIDLFPTMRPVFLGDDADSFSSSSTHSTFDPGSSSSSSSSTSFVTTSSSSVMKVIGKTAPAMSKEEREKAEDEEEKRAKERAADPKKWEALQNKFVEAVFEALKKKAAEAETKGEKMSAFLYGVDWEHFIRGKDGPGKVFLARGWADALVKWDKLGSNRPVENIILYDEFDELVDSYFDNADDKDKVVEEAIEMIKEFASHSDTGPREWTLIA